MLCLKAEALRRELYASSHGVILPVNLGSSIQRAAHKGGGGLPKAQPFVPSTSSSSSADGCTSCSGTEFELEDARGNGNVRGREKGGKMCDYRAQLEQEVQKLQKHLQEEIDLHIVLANAVGRCTLPLVNSTSKLPYKAQELLANIAALETTVSKLEEELVALHFRLSQERNERRVAENNLNILPSLSTQPSPLCTSCYTWEEHISSLRYLKLNGTQVPNAPHTDMIYTVGCSQPNAVSMTSDVPQQEEASGFWSRGVDTNIMDTAIQESNDVESKKDFLMPNLWHNPNQLSEEMVRCMRNIFLCLSESSPLSSTISSSDCIPSQYSPDGHLSRSSLNSFSDSSAIPSMLRSPSTSLRHSSDASAHESMFDPYRISGKVSWSDIGGYNLAAEVSWMSVGKMQLEYAAVALKRFRLLVEQLAKVNPGRLDSNARLAFWINIYNALIMHAYLAYGVPKSEIKLFSLMLKVSYTVGGQCFSAADIEFFILKMKPPSHRPQIALILALHKFKVSEEHRKYSIDDQEPLALFALSSGMYSSPAVRIYTAEKVHVELQNAMRDYIRASVGISDKGKLLVPKLLQSFAKGVVEDSLLVDWICRYLSPDQVTVVRDSASQRKQRLLGVRSFSIIPFDTRFRYLFLPDDSEIGEDVAP